MSNLYSKIGPKPPKRIQENINLSQTWMNAEVLNNGSLNLSPPHTVCQKETLPVLQPVSAPESPSSSSCSSPTVSTSLLDSNWQATKHNVRQRNAAMFNNELMSDIKFIVGPPGSTHVIPAHKYVLSTGSSVFYAMFYGGLAEVKEEIEVPDVEPSAFLALLKYLYCDEAQLEADTVLATLYVAKKYIVPHLARACVTYLETSLTAKNACLLLSQSRLFEEFELMQRCWEVIDAQWLEWSSGLRQVFLRAHKQLWADLPLPGPLIRRRWQYCLTDPVPDRRSLDHQIRTHTILTKAPAIVLAARAALCLAEMAVKSEGFTDIDMATLESILARETLNCKEMVLLEAALNWATAECLRRELEVTPQNKREILGNALYLIRIPTMSLEEFANGAAQIGILTQQEIIDIFFHFTANSKPCLQYPIKPRSGLKSHVCHRFQSSAYRGNQWRYRGRCDSIQFSVDHRIFVVGFGLYGSSNGGADYTVKIELKRLGRVLAENNTKFFSDGSSKTFHVYFDNPIQIEPDAFYTASVILDGDKLSYFGQEGLSETTVGQVTFQFQCSSESTNGTGVQGGQIPELIFYGPSVNL